VEVTLVTDAPLNPYVQIEAASPNFRTVQIKKPSGLGFLTGFNFSVNHGSKSPVVHSLLNLFLTFLDLFSFLRPVSSVFHVENSDIFPGQVM
jgi:hypothetical protein